MPPGPPGPPGPPPASNVKGFLWRRLLREWRSRGATKRDAAVTAGGDSRRSSRESLSPSELDVTVPDVTVRPLHGSVAGHSYCFQVVTAHCSRSFVCPSLAERDRWIEELRRTARPDRDNRERQDTSLTIQISEGRHLPPRHPLRCHVRLAGALLARTAAKVAGADGHLFWGELFQLPALPPADAVTVELRRDGHNDHDDHNDRDDHHGRLLAVVTIPLAEMTDRPVERWYPLTTESDRWNDRCSDRRSDRCPAVRLRGRCRHLRVLPIVHYKELAEFVTFHYGHLCGHLEPAIGVRHKEELAGALVRVLRGTGKAKSFLIDLGLAELDRCDDHEALLFRENTVATKAIDEYMRLVGGQYLQDTLGSVVTRLCRSGHSTEVDPSRCSGPELDLNRTRLRSLCQDTLRSITQGTESFPAELAAVFAAWRSECVARGKPAMAQRLVSASLFLRLLCPAMMTPNLFGLVPEYPGPDSGRTLTLVAKVIQNLANFSTFGQKEPYMAFMNDFLEQHWATMSELLVAVAVAEPAGHSATFEGGAVDLALELAGLHALLRDICDGLAQATQDALEPLPTILRAITEGTPVPVSVQLSATAGTRPAFVPPRALSTHSPLVKSHSLSSVRHPRGHPEATATATSREPSPVPAVSPGVSPVVAPVVSPVVAPAVAPVATRQRRNVQRTQSVPAQGKAKADSAGHAAQGTAEGDTGTIHPPEPGDGPPRGKLRCSVSLPRKPAVPWQRLAEDAAAPGELCVLRPLDKHGRLLAALREELAELRERLERAERAEERNRERLERGRDLLTARLTAAEGSQKQDLERLKNIEERGQRLEQRLSALERELRVALGHLRVPNVSPRGWDEPGDDAQATSV